MPDIVGPKSRYRGPAVVRAALVQLQSLRDAT
jgi:hypothetical protein